VLGQRVAVSTVGAATLVVLVALARTDPASGGLPRCPLHQLTGLWCPGCGSQRALHALLHGHVGSAIGLNVLLTCALPLLVYAYVAWVTRAFAPATSTARLPPLAVPSIVVRALPAVVLAFAVVRNVPFGHALAP
jgi:hypothetical protein